MTPWARAEDALLRRFYPELGAKGCAPMLPGRSLKSIRERAYRNGVKARHRGQVLTAEDARLIRRLMADRDELLRRARLLTNTRFAEKFGVHPNTIDSIAKGNLWKAA